MTTNRAVDKQRETGISGPIMKSIIVDQKWKKPILIKAPQPKSGEKESRETYEYYFTSQEGENIQVNHESWLAHETGDRYLLNPPPRKTDTVHPYITYAIISILMLVIAVLLYSTYIY